MLGAEMIKIYRDTNSQTTVKGVPVADSRQEITIRASVQPLTPEEIIEESQGADRSSDSIKIYTTYKLIPLDETNKTRPDHLAYQGNMYEVRSVLPYTMKSRLSHFKAIAVRIDTELA